MSLKEVGLRLEGVDVWLIDIYKDGDMGVIEMFKKKATCDSDRCFYKFNFNQNIKCVIYDFYRAYYNIKTHVPLMITEQDLLWLQDRRLSWKHSQLRVHAFINKNCPTHESQRKTVEYTSGFSSSDWHVLTLLFLCQEYSHHC